MPPLCCPPLLSLVASNDGFLCFEGHREPNIPTIFVHNPTTPNLWNVLTVPESGPIVFQNCFIGIAFDRNLGACKIVLAGPISKKMTRTLIFDAKNDTWRKLKDLDDVFVPRMKEPFVFNGLFCWLAWSRGQKSEMVVSFDVENEKWEEPLVLDDRRSTPLCMAELEKQACVISVNKKNPQKLELRKLDIQGKRNYKWVKTITAPFQMVSSNNISAFGGGDVMCIGSYGRFWVYHIKDKVWSYVGLFHEDVLKCRNVVKKIKFIYKYLSFILSNDHCSC
jgi:F-box interacting protein